MSHLTPDELIDAAEGTLDPARREHLTSCEWCAREAAGLAAVLHETRRIEAPEPSPMFWEHFSARVRTAIDAESIPGGGWTNWLRWPVLAPIGALALIVLVLMRAVPFESTHTLPQGIVAAESSDIVLSEDGWTLVADLVGDMDWDTADAAGVAVGPGLADQAALDLSEPEQQELSRLLRAELERVKS